MLKLWNINRILFRNLSSRAESRYIDDVIQSLHTEVQPLQAISRYYFDGSGKGIRPQITRLVADACNEHLKVSSPETVSLQKDICMISEMFHTSSLYHDDVIDKAATRRGKESVNCRWNQSYSLFAGDYILGVASTRLARTNNPEVIETMFQVLDDLVVGEFQQMTTKKDKTDRFNLYLEKSYNKTASIIANACKSVAILSADSQDTPEDEKSILKEKAFEFGKNIGISFQLIDDLLDFTSTGDLLGKPSVADLGLGLATGPVLFASQEFPQLEPLILRRFSRAGDVETAWELVIKSAGLDKTRALADRYRLAAEESIGVLTDSPYRQNILHLTREMMSREK